MSRRNGSSNQRKHGNPGSLRKQRANQVARDLARQRGHEARDEITQVRLRALQLSGFHGSINAIVRKSNIIAASHQSTTHLNLEQFCAYAEELRDRLFRLEQDIVRNTKHEIWGHDPELTLISQALTLERRAKELEGDFNFRISGIEVYYPGVSAHFALTEDGLNACATIILCCENVELERQDKLVRLVEKGDCDSYWLADQRVRLDTNTHNLELLSRRSPLLASDRKGNQY